MRFDIYGHFEIEIERENGQWVAYRRGNGLRLKEHSIVIPSDVSSSEIGQYLDDIFHERSGPRDAIKQLD